jgi:hypothetical protein
MLLRSFKIQRARIMLYLNVQITSTFSRLIISTSESQWQFDHNWYRQLLL